MNCKVEKTDNANEVKLEITVESSKFDEAIKKVYFKSAKYFNIPGFRKGKAPINIVEKYYGKEIFYEDAFNEIASKEFEEALEKEKMVAVSQPEVDIKQIEKGKELIFTLVFQIKPEIKLEKYKGIEIEKIEYNVEDKDIEHELEHMREHNSRLISIEDRPVENGDTVIIDFKGYIDGEPFEGGEGEDYELEIGSKTFIQGFEEQIIGMEIDAEKEIKVKFPEEYFSAELAGKDATFEVALHEIKKKELPKLDDEFAKDVSEFDTIKELKEDIKQKLEKSNAEKQKYETEEAVIKAICDTIKEEIPSGMVETEINNKIKDIETRLSYQGLNLEQYLNVIGKTKQELIDEYRPEALESVKSRLMLEAVIKAEKIKVTKKEIDEKMKEMAKNYKKEDDEQFLNNENVRKYIEENIQMEKAVEMLVENAKIK